MNIRWYNEKRNITDLKPAEYNPRQLTEKEAKDLITSLERFNLADPIVINKDNTVIGGHMRINILQEKGINEVDVRVPDKVIPKDKERELNLRLNKNLGEWDFDLLANFDEELLKDVGFESKELDKIFQLDTETEVNEVPDIRETNIKFGDMFQLGEHRLLCGDAIKQKDVERLMQNEKADMIFTDPPYGIDLDTKYSGMPSRLTNPAKYKNRYRKVIGDNEKFNATFLFEIIRCKEMFLFGANYYIDSLPNYGKNGSFMVWDKRRNESMDKGFGSNFELIWSKIKHKQRMLRYEWFGLFGEHKKDGFFHPTQKPVSLCEEIIKSYSDRNYNILDLFLGSGSTLIACERLNRKCYGMEIDPQYCQVIIDRWEAYTQRKAQKL